MDEAISKGQFVILSEAKNLHLIKNLEDSSYAAAELRSFRMTIS
jgi:hypothetical protein